MARGNEYYTYEIANGIDKLDDLFKLQVLGVALLEFPEHTGYPRAVEEAVRRCSSIQDRCFAAQELLLLLPTAGHVKVALMAGLSVVSNSHRLVSFLLREVESLPDGINCALTREGIGGVIESAIHNYGLDAKCRM